MKKTLAPALVPLRRNRQCQREGAAAAERRFHRDRPAKHVLRDLAHDREADARPFARRLGGESRFENAFPVFRSDAGAPIAYREPQRFAGAFRGDRDDGAGLTRVHGVADEVRKYLIQRACVSEEVERIHRRLPFEGNLALAGERPFEGDAGADYRRDVEADEPRGAAEWTVLNGAQIARRLLDALGDMPQIVEQRVAEPPIQRIGFSDRLDAEIEVAQSHRERITHFVRDDARLTGQLPQRITRRQTGTRRLRRGAERAQTQPRELEDQALAAAPLDPVGRGSGWAGADGSDAPVVAVIQATADPATMPDDGRSPLAERAIEIETEVLRRGVREPAEQRHSFGVGRDLP